jgi:hypothetical protein
MAGRPFRVRVVDGDVEAGVADGVVGGGEAAAVAELGEDRGRAHRPDPVQLLDQGAAARLAARKCSQLAVEWRQLVIEAVEHAQAELDQLTSGGGKVRPRQRLATGLRA